MNIHVTILTLILLQLLFLIISTVDKAAEYTYDLAYLLLTGCTFRVINGTGLNSHMNEFAP